MVDNADMQRVARMVAGTQRVRIRPLWDDQKMRQTMAAAYGLDRLGKTMAAAYGLDRLGKTMAAAYGLDRFGKTMAAAHRERMRPLFNTPKFVGPMFGGELQQTAQAMAEAHRVAMRPALDASKVIRVGLGGEKMRQMMVGAAGLDKIAKIMADSYQVRVPPLFDTQKLVGSMFGGELQRFAQAMADAYQVPVRPRFDVRGVVEVAQSLVDVTIAVPSTPTTGSLAVVDGSVPAKTPLFPGLVNPWEQVRCWDLQAWIAFLTFLVAVAGLWVAIGQSRPQGGLGSEELEQVIRIIQEYREPRTSSSAPSSTIGATRPKPTQPLDDEKGHVPTVRPSPTSG